MNKEQYVRALRNHLSRVEAEFMQDFSAHFWISMHDATMTEILILDAEEEFKKQRIYTYDDNWMLSAFSISNQYEKFLDVWQKILTVEAKENPQTCYAICCSFMYQIEKSLDNHPFTERRFLDALDDSLPKRLAKSIVDRLKDQNLYDRFEE